MKDIYNKIPKGLEDFLKKNNSMTTPIVFEGDNAYDIFSRLMKERIIYLCDVITAKTANIIKSQLLFLDSQEYKGKMHSDIIIYIDSPGGSVYAGLGLYDTMQYIKSDVSTVCVGVAASMASVILAAGKKGKRYALPNSTIMIHQPLLSSGGETKKADDLRVITKEITRLENIIADIYSKHTGKNKEEILKSMRLDNYMSAEEALKFGLIDEIIYPDKK